MKNSRYKKNLSETIDRLELLTNRDAQDRIFANFVTPTEVMRQFARDFKGQSPDYPNPQDRIEFWMSYLHERRDITDDGIPYVYPSEFDQGLYGGLLGGDVRFLCNTDPGYVSSGWICSMMPPMLNALSELETLTVQQDGMWMDRYRRLLKLYSEKAQHDFGISHLIVIDSFNFVYELIGASETYIAMYTEPELLHKAIDFGYELNCLVHDIFFEMAGLYYGGTCSWVMPWIPGRIICESVDPFHMVSVDDFVKWGLEPIHRIFSRYDGGVLHLHANGWHLLEEAAKIEGLRGILLVDEKDHTPAIEQIGELQKRAAGVPLTVMMEFDDFERRLRDHSLPGNIFYYVSNTPGVDVANRCADKVREYRV